MRLTKWNKRLGTDRNGGIEGLPLQLIILVVIAGAGTAIMLGWMGGLEAPQTLSGVYTDPTEVIVMDEDHDGIFENRDIDLTVTVLDQNGDPIADGTVVLSGCGIVTSMGGTPHCATDAQGKASFTDLQVSYAGNGIGIITVQVVKGGHGGVTTTSLPVVCG